MGGKTSYSSIKKYQDKVYDKINVVLPKGTKDQIRKQADLLGLSVNAFIKEAIKEKMEKTTSSKAEK